MTDFPTAPPGHEPRDRYRAGPGREPFSERKWFRVVCFVLLGTWVLACIIGVVLLLR